MVLKLDFHRIQPPSYFLNKDNENRNENPCQAGVQPRQGQAKPGSA
jgi:hypothetical protein